VNLILNGEKHNHAADGGLLSILSELGIEAKHVAIMVNDRVIRRDLYSQTTVSDGDRIEILTLAAGG